MSFQWVDGSEIFIPRQLDFSDDEEENINPSSDPHKLASKKKRKKSPKNKKKIDRDALLLEKAIKEAEEEKAKKIQASQKVEVSPLDFSDLAGAIRSYRQAFEKAPAFRNLFCNYKNFEAGLSRADDFSMLAALVDRFENLYPKALKEKTAEHTASEIYGTILHNMVAEKAVKTAQSMVDSSIFKKYPPRKCPMVICVLQRSLKDVFPTSQILIPFKILSDLGMVPKNALDFNPFNSELVCFSLFWSLSRIHSSYGSVFFKEGEGMRFHWMVFDRSKPNEPFLDRERMKIKNEDGYVTF